MGAMKTLNVERAMRGGGRRGRPGAGMIGLQAGYFFNQGVVQKALDRATAKILGRAGGATRLTAQRSIKRMGLMRKTPRQWTKKGRLSKAYQKWIQEVRERPPSPPGQPPHTWTGFLREDIVYAYDPATKKVVVGPYRQPWLNRLMEYGGVQPMRVWRSKLSGRTFLFSKTPRSHQGLEETSETVLARYPPRPFMAPAMRKIQPTLPYLWANSIKTP